MASFPIYHELYHSNRELFNKYLTEFHKQNPKLDLFQSEMILRTPIEKLDDILEKYASGEIVDEKHVPKHFDVISATIKHPDDEVDYPIEAWFEN
jgi:hypothetical protein